MSNKYSATDIFFDVATATGVIAAATFAGVAIARALTPKTVVVTEIIREPESGVKATASLFKKPW